MGFPTSNVNGLYQLDDMFELIKLYELQFVRLTIRSL